MLRVCIQQGTIPSDFTRDLGYAMLFVSKIDDFVLVQFRAIFRTLLLRNLYSKIPRELDEFESTMFGKIKIKINCLHSTRNCIRFTGMLRVIGVT